MKEKHVLIALFVCVSAVEVVALLKGIDGGILQLYLAFMGAGIGYAGKAVVDRRRDKGGE